LGAETSTVGPAAGAAVVAVVVGVDLVMKAAAAEAAVAVGGAL